LRAVQLASDSPLGAREFLFRLGGGLGVVGTTTVITAPAEGRGGALHAAGTAADVLLALSLALHGARARRTIEPIKVPGAAPLRGLHGLAIDREGATVYPRLEARVLAEADAGAVPPPEGAGAGFGLAALDGLLGGGLTRGTTTLVLGSPGTGKTL